MAFLTPQIGVPRTGTAFLTLRIGVPRTELACLAWRESRFGDADRARVTWRRTRRRRPQQPSPSSLLAPIDRPRARSRKSAGQP